jgi:hypothetical protein
VVEPGQRLCLAGETLGEARFFADGRRETLHGDDSV